MCGHTTWVVQTILLDTSTGDHVDYLEIDQDDYYDRTALARQYSEMRSWLYSVCPTPQAESLEMWLRVIYRPTNTSKQRRIYKMGGRYSFKVPSPEGPVHTLERAVKTLKEDLLATQDTPPRGET